MPFEHALWKLGGALTRLAPAALDDEKVLEDYISTDIGILNDQWMLVGRQVHTDYGKFIDLLALDEAATLVVIVAEEAPHGRAAEATIRNRGALAKSPERRRGGDREQRAVPDLLHPILPLAYGVALGPRW